MDEIKILLGNAANNYNDNQIAVCLKMALNEIRSYCNREIDYELESKGFTSCSQGGLTGVFTRDRKLNLKNLVLLVMSVNSSIQRTLDRFYKSLNKSDYNLREVTKGAFSRHVEN